MNSKYYTAVFKSYEKGYYTFKFDDGENIVFEQVHSKILLKYDLKNDKTLINNIFHLVFSEDIDDDEEDFVIFRIEYLELINAN